MSKLAPSFFLLRPVRDEYGRRLGHVISFAFGLRGRVEEVIVQRDSGGIIRFPVNRLKLEGTDIVLLSPLKEAAERLRDEITSVRHKERALIKLSKDKAPEDVYECLRKGFEDAFNQLKDEAQGIIKGLDEQISLCNLQAKELSLALASLEIEHNAEGIDEASYRKALEAVSEELKRVSSERAELELVKKRLLNALSEELKVVEGAIVQEKPILVYVKEALDFGGEERR